MIKYFISIFFFGLFLLVPGVTFADSNSTSFVNVVNPVRGTDYWEMPNQKPEDAVSGQIEILKARQVPATWLLRYDALKNEQILNALKSSSTTDEKGLFLEVTPTFTQDAGVVYRQSQYWHFAESVLLTGYDLDERQKLIDTAFEGFKKIYGTYPRSIGAWWIDGGSLEYMQKKYGVTGALIVADQYSTDNYQIWGQYWSTPYYPNKHNALYPAQETNLKIPVVMMQWAARDPVNGYGKGVEESTYSVQANDYIDYHGLDINYFSKLVDIYTTQKQNPFGEIVIGLENSYSWQKYAAEYANQIQSLIDKQKSGQIQINTMGEFSNWYINRFPELSQPHSIIAEDPLGSDRRVVWFMNTFYRAGWFSNNQGSVFRDVRQYIAGDREPCLDSACKAVNFATFKTRSLDEVTFSDKYLIDPGRVKEFKAVSKAEGLTFTYQNDAGKSREVKFLPRDIQIDDKVWSVDGFILAAKQQSSSGGEKIEIKESVNPEFFKSFATLGLEVLLFLLFILISFVIPGFVFTRFIKEEFFTARMYLAVTMGITGFTLASFFAGLMHSFWLLYAYDLIFFWLFLHNRMYKQITFNFKLSRKTFFLGLLLLGGTFFQGLAVWRSGWVYEFGMGFWGPTGHDHIWHAALNNQILKGLPVENPIFSDVILTNYHYFFNLLLGSTSAILRIDSIDLLFRLYPLLFSLLLGIGFFVLTQKLFRNYFISICCVYLTYFGSSFGWIVDYLRTKTFGGESNFWINQPVSFNLNPPFAISLILLLSSILLFEFILKKIRFGVLLFVVVTGTLIEFKVYGGLIALTALVMVFLTKLLVERDLIILKSLLPTALLSGLLFIPQNSGSANLIVFSPFWFIHSMVESPDRLGLMKLAEARMAYQMRGDNIKFFLSELLAFAIFVAGNLGTRFIALFLMPALLLKRVRTDGMLQYILWIILISFTVPIFFIQKGTPWNTIQFSYYAVYLSSFFASVVLVKTIEWLIRKSKFLGLAGLIILVFFLLITPISSFSTFKDGFGKIPPSRLTFGEMEALSFLSKQADGVVLTHPFDKKLRERFNSPYPLFAYETSSYVSAFSKHPTYMEDEIQMDIMQLDYQKRLVGQTEFFRGRDATWSSGFLRSNHIRYIYLPSIFGITLNETELNISKIFENSQVSIFRVN